MTIFPENRDNFMNKTGKASAVILSMDGQTNIAVFMLILLTVM